MNHTKYNQNIVFFLNIISLNISYNIYNIDTISHVLPTLTIILTNGQNQGDE